MQRDTFNGHAKKQQCGSLARQQIDWEQVIEDQWGETAVALLRSIPDETDPEYMHRGAFDSTAVYWGYSLAYLVRAAISCRKPDGPNAEYFATAKDWAKSAPGRDSRLERAMSAMNADDVVAAGQFMFCK